MNKLSVRDFLASLRPIHWVKNLYLFLPFIFGKKLFDLPILMKGAAAFFLFSFAASAAYLINDITDIEYDRCHPIKKLRPIASGKVGVGVASFSALVLGIASVVLSFLLDIYFGWVVLGYLLFNFIYSKILKEIVIIDVFSIGAFFYARILVGSIIARVQLSQWIIFMTVLLALFIGFNKRRQELKLFEHKAVSCRIVLSKYDAYFIDQIIGVVTSSVVVTYMLYTVDVKTVERFGSSHLIYSIPFVYYGIFRYLYLILRLQRDGDPIRILLSDWKIQINLILWLIVCIGVIYFRL